MQTWPIFIVFIILQSTRSADEGKFIKYKKWEKKNKKDEIIFHKSELPEESNSLFIHLNFLHF